jgi:AcrR family transcriptional regulator
MSTPITERGLRARRKQRTRADIVAAAEALFAEHGFEAVAVADVAHRAEVSEQTVYNYFKSKEALVFDEAEEFEARFTAMVRQRAKGTSLTAAVRRQAHEFLAALRARPDSPHRRGGMPYLIAANPAVRRHWLALLERFAQAVADALVSENRKLPKTTAKVLGIAVMAVFAVIVEEVGEAARQGLKTAGTLSRLKREVDLAIEALEHGIDRAMP